MFVESSGTEDDLLFSDSKLYRILDAYQYTIKLLVSLPDPANKPDCKYNMYYSTKLSTMTAFNNVFAYL